MPTPVHVSYPSETSQSKGLASNHPRHCRRGIGVLSRKSPCPRATVSGCPLFPRALRIARRTPSRCFLIGVDVGARCGRLGDRDGARDADGDGDDVSASPVLSAARAMYA